MESSLQESDRRLMAYKKKVKMREDMDLYAKQKEKEKILLKKFRENVPKLLQCYCEGSISIFDELRRDPMFMLKTVMICEDCYLDFTEFIDVAGAPGGYDIKINGSPKKLRIAEVQKQYKPPMWKS